MIRINEKVTVGMSDRPKWVLWRSRTYKIIKIGLHHTYKKGLTLHHIFSVVCDTSFMRLDFDTKNLSWRLEEMENGI